MYRLGVRVGGRVVPFDYRSLALDRPRRVVLQAAHGHMCRRTPSRWSAPGSGSRVRYDAVLEPRGLLRLASPRWPGSFAKMADRGAAGLRRALA